MGLPSWGKGRGEMRQVGGDDNGGEDGERAQRREKETETGERDRDSGRDGEKKQPHLVVWYGGDKALLGLVLCGAVAEDALPQKVRDAGVDLEQLCAPAVVLGERFRVPPQHLDGGCEGVKGRARVCG